MDTLTSTSLTQFIVLLFVAAALVWLGQQSLVVSPFNGVIKFIGYFLFIVAAFDLVIFLLRLVFNF